jgi:iron complex outermembrane receptor protein
LVVNAGGMLERDAMGYHHFSPRASLNYHLTPQHTLRMGTSVAHRTPSLTEQLGVLLVPGLNSPSPGLPPEKIVSREIGYIGDFHDTGTLLDLRIFNDHINDGLYPAGTFWKSGMTIVYTGFEATLKHSFDKAGDLTLNYAKAMAHSNYTALAPGQPDWLALSVPRNSGSLLYSLRLPDDWAFSTAYYLQTASLGFDRGPIDYQPTQHRTDIRIAKSFKTAGGWTGEVACVVQNLFATDYTEYIATALFNRRAFVTLTFHQ